MKFVDLERRFRELRPSMDAAVKRVMDRGKFIMGPELEDFERRFAAICGAKHCIGVASGTDALTLALWASGLGENDVVLVPSWTAFPTWAGVTRAGCVVEAVEPDEDFCMDPSRMDVQPWTKGVVPVHLYGRACDPRVVETAKEHGLVVVHDCCQAHGLEIDLGEKDCAAYSFYPTKNLSALGDGGAVVTNSIHIADCVRTFRNYGWREPNYVAVGMNSRLDELQAALLWVQIPTFLHWNQRRAHKAMDYIEGLRDVPDLVLPRWTERHVWHQFVIRHPRRDELKLHLLDEGVRTMVHYRIPPPLSMAYGPEQCPIAQEYAQTVLSLPIGPEMTREEQKRVIQAVRNFR